MTTLGEVGEWGSGGTPSRKQTRFFGGDIPWLKIGDLVDGPVGAAEESITKEGLAQSAAKLIPEGAVLVAMYGSIGKLGIAGKPLATNQAIAHCLTHSDVLVPKFLFYWLLYRRSALVALGKGGTQQNISQTVLKSFPVPAPSLAEQSQTVARIDELLPCIDAATADLRRTQRKLSIARASILKAAVEGRLVPTEAELARKEGREYEHASVLLQRILDERRARHEAEQVDATRKKKYKEPVKPVVDDLPALPEGWVWATMDQLADVAGGITKNRAQNTSGKPTPFLRVANVYADELRLDDVATIRVPESRLPGALLQRGDLLIVEGNGSADQIGRVAAWNDSISPCTHQNHLIRARPLPGFFPAWGVKWMLSPQGRSLVRSVASSTSGLFTLSLSKVRSLVVALPPEHEAVRVIAEVDRRLSILDKIEETVDANLRRCERLRQSILKAAFEGRLVPEDPTTEEPLTTELEPEEVSR